MNTELRYVPLEHVAATWPQIEHFIQSMEQYGPNDHTLAQMRMRACTGDWLLGVYVENEELVGATLISFQNFPNDRVAFVCAVGGKGILTQDGYAQLRTLCASRGATRMQGYMRPSLVRLLKRRGAKEMATLMDDPL